MPDREPFDLREISEITDADAGDRLGAAVADQMGGAQVIAVELLVVRTFLLADEDGAADRDHVHVVRHGADHPDGVDPGIVPEGAVRGGVLLWVEA